MLNATEESVVKVNSKILCCYKHHQCTYTTTQRQATGPPTTTCDGSTEGSSEFNPVTPDIIWICKSGEWIPYQ